MFVIKRSINILKFFNYPQCLCSYSTVADRGRLQHIPKFSLEDEKKILDILNESDAQKLSLLDVSQVRIKNLEIWKSKKGPFKSIPDILEVDGLGVKNLERLCESIITTDLNKLEKMAKLTLNGNNNKNKRHNFVTPIILANLSSNITSAVGLHLDPAGISWAKIRCDGNKLDTWNYYDFSNLPKKMLPNETFDLAMNILTKLPIGDLYVLESPLSIGPAGQKQSMAMSYTHNLELSSMLMALINTSPKHCIMSPDAPGDTNNNRVYFLRSKLPARLFRTLIGNERVSSTSTVDKLLSAMPTTAEEPIACTPITSELAIKQFYSDQPTVHKELLGQALMLTVTFMDLCVYKKEISINAVVGRKRSKPESGY